MAEQLPAYDGALQEAFSKLGFDTIKPEQLQAVAGVMKGDTFVVLPTGFGK